jgi:hypothetical protein
MLEAVVVAILAVQLTSVWLTSRWAAIRSRNALLVALSIAVVVYCLTVLAYGVVWQLQDAPLRSRATAFLEPATRFVLILLLPACTCICAAQLLLKQRAAARLSRLTATCLGLFVIGILPFAVPVAGCGLQGTCVIPWLSELGSTASIERTSSSGPRLLAAVAHVEG